MPSQAVGAAAMAADTVVATSPATYHSRRDLVGDLASAVRARGLRMGLYYAGRTVPTRAVNHFDVRTYEYEVPLATAGIWETTRGLGDSFGFNAGEDASRTMTGDDLVHLLVDVVARGGRLLINVGPGGHGRIPDVQHRPLRVMGDWLADHGDAVFGTEPWTTTAADTTDGLPVRFTRAGSTVHAIPERIDQQDGRRRRGRCGRRGGRPPAFGPGTYRHRNVVERCFNRLKQCRSVATRYDKTVTSFRATVTIAALLQWL
jgi:transposase